MNHRESIKRFLARHRRNRLIRKIGLNLGYYFHGYENHEYDPQFNGEKFCLERLAALTPSATIFDVGAHHGEWTTMARGAATEAIIHSFEVVPATFRRLANTCGGMSRVSLHNVGLSDVEGEIDIAVAVENDALSSGLAGLHGDFHKFSFTTVKCAVTAGDRFCDTNAIPAIDYLKLDVEGLEPRVLSGFSRLLAEGRIGAIQFEYGQINLKARFFLEDYYRLLRPLGMTIGKIYPNYVDFRDYHFTQDDLAGPNYLAVHESRRDLIEALT